MKSNQSATQPIKGVISSPQGPQPPVPWPHIPTLSKPKLQKKGDWRMWKEKTEMQKKLIEALERKLKEAEDAPTHIWRRIKI